MKGRMNAARLAAVVACSLALASCEYITAQTITDNGSAQGNNAGQFMNGGGQGQFQGQGRNGAAPGADGVQSQNGGTGGQTRDGTQTRNGGQTAPQTGN